MVRTGIKEMGGRGFLRFLFLINEDFKCLFVLCVCLFFFKLDRCNTWLFFRLLYRGVKDLGIDGIQTLKENIKSGDCPARVILTICLDWLSRAMDLQNGNAETEK